MLPAPFFFRIAYPCPYVARMPRDREEFLLDLPEFCRVHDLADRQTSKRFADLRLAWNEFGMGVRLEVRGKEELPKAVAGRPQSSDGLTLWLDTRDARTSHRASRYCHQFLFLPVGGGPDGDQPYFAQLKINRALQDAPICSPEAIHQRCHLFQTGYVLEAFLPADVLNGFDPELNRRLGFYYMVRDAELGEEYLSVGPEFPFADDPSLWSVLELQTPTAAAPKPAKRKRQQKKRRGDSGVFR
ncbi:MAG: hypothetical protein KatS3mg105_0006 [Gemmatales bacterium]|nr:MAG: hypothetical protein KatS3mg105_0006 [Gemmatales bacterium]